MSSVKRGETSLAVWGRAVTAGLLCVWIAGQPLVAESAAKQAGLAKKGQMQEQQRVLHVLNRLTFGPRRGDLAAVEKIGLNTWFERQLNPGSIDDAALESRLMEYPAMQMPLDQLAATYPSPGRLRQMMNGDVPLPADPAERAMVQDQIAFYKMAKARQEKAKADDSTMAAQDEPAKQREPATFPAKRRKQVQAGLDALNDADGSAADGKMQDKPIPAGEISVDAVMSGPAPDASSRELAARIINLPPDQRMKAILAVPATELVKLRQSLGGPQLARLTEGMTAQEKEKLAALAGSLRMVALESMESRLLRDVYSERQLEAVMTDFWLNHFNVYVRKNQNEPYLIPAYERETIRPRALGRFEDLLVATAKSPAMLVYLDNYRSVGPNSAQAERLKTAQDRFPDAKLLKQASAGLNENYGRELMELHTLGVNGGYTQADVTNVAKVFTGWGLDRPRCGGGFAFDQRRHEPGEKIVLGTVVGNKEEPRLGRVGLTGFGRGERPCEPANRATAEGEKEGLQVLHMLATSPATAHFISQKLAVRFVSDTPPATLVEKMAESFLKSDGDIKAVLRTMFHAPEFWSAEVYRAKVKTPEEFVVSAVRASGAEVVNPQALVQSLDKLGMPLYGMQTPNGYSWTKEGWVSTGALVSRMNFALVLSGGRMPGVKTGWTRMLGEGGVAMVPAAYPADDAGLRAKERRLEMALLGVPVSEQTRGTVLAQSGDSTVAEQAETQFDLRGGGGKRGYAARGLGRALGGGAGDDAQAALMAGLLLGSPEFQRR